MEELFTSEHFVPSVDNEHEESLLGQQLQGKVIKHGQSPKSFSLQMPILPDEQIKTGEELVDENSFGSFTEATHSIDITNQQCSETDNSMFSHCAQEVPSTPNKAVDDMYNHLKPADEVDGSSSSTGSSDSYNSGSSASCDSGSDEVHNFTSWSRNQCNEKYSADNEVVSGRQYPMHAMDERANVPLNFDASLNTPKQQTCIPNDGGSLVVSNDAWPPQLELKGAIVPHVDAMETDGQPVQSISDVESLPVPVTNQKVNNSRDMMVIGLPQTSMIAPLGPSIVSPDIIGDAHYFLEKGVDELGRNLNPFVSAMHNDTDNEVKFRVPKKIRRVRRNHRRTSVTENVPVSNPLTSSEAKDGRYVLRHMCSESVFRFYADALDIPSSKFKMMIKQIRGRTPRRRNPSLTWPALFDTLYLMRNFIEKVADGLECSSKSNLATNVRVAIHNLTDITENAERAKQLLSQFSK